MVLIKVSHPKLKTHLFISDNCHRLDLWSEEVCELRGADDRLQAQPLLDPHLGRHRPPRHGRHLPLLLLPLGAREVRDGGVPPVGAHHRLLHVPLLDGLDPRLRHLLDVHDEGFNEGCECTLVSLD